MNNKLLVSLILGALPLTMMAQDDDMYFVPTKKSAPKVTVRKRPAPTFYSGSDRSVDEYNRRVRSTYEILPTDTTASDIIDYDGKPGVYPDSTMMTEDFALTREMSRWDGYEPEETYMEGYRDGRRDSWAWHSPWFYSSYYPWYDSYWYWNDPWYYGRYGWYSGWYGWYDPWYYDYYYNPWYYGHYGWYGGYYPYYGGTSIVYNGPAGTERHGRISYNGPRGISNGRTTTYSAGTFGGRSLGSSRTGSFGSSRSSASRSTTAVRSTTGGRVTNANGNFGGSRSSSSTSSASRSYTPTYSNSTPTYSNSTPTYSGSSSSSSSSGSFGGGGSYGGSRSSGGGGGASRGGGGGHFGGRR